MDYIKNHNALTMKEVSDLRASIMRRNAHLVVWLADHIGTVQMQMMHKKSAAPEARSPVIPSRVSTYGKEECNALHLSFLHFIPPSRLH